jgi:hypothetical protein
MSLYVVIATSPVMDVSRVVGPFRSIEKALDAGQTIETKGYNTEVVELENTSDIDDSDGWDES